MFWEGTIEWFSDSTQETYGNPYWWESDHIDPDEAAKAQTQVLRDEYDDSSIKLVGVTEGVCTP